MRIGIAGSPRRRPTTSGPSKSWRLELLVAFGRDIWREDPHTPGIYEYKDTKDYRGPQRVVDKSSWERVREEEVEDEKAVP